MTGARAAAGTDSGVLMSDGQATGGAVSEVNDAIVSPELPTWPQLLSELVAGHDLTYDQVSWAMDRIMSDEVGPSTLGAFLIGLAAKGEAVAELKALADTMLRHAKLIELPPGGVDIVGTGGDRARTVNISTMASLVIAGAGVPVAKHGNRASSSASGSADVLEALGVNLTMSVPRVVQGYREVGIAFLFANLFHPAMRFAAPTRRELGIGTVFNVLGPLTNPARPRACAIGVANARHAVLVAGVLAQRGLNALVFRGENGLDELSSTAINQVWWVKSGQVNYQEFDARCLDIPASTIAQLQGDDAQYNAAIARRVLGGNRCIISQTVALNAAAALVAAQPGSGTLAEELAVQYRRACHVLDSGAAAEVLQRWVEFSAG